MVDGIKLLKQLKKNRHLGYKGSYVQLSTVTDRTCFYLGVTYMGPFYSKVRNYYRQPG